MTPSSESALLHLRSLKPLDGWAIEKKAGSARLVRLTRRSIAITDSYFFDVHHDSASKTVVGILTEPKNGRTQAQVLVDASGKPSGPKIKLVSVSTYPVKASAAASTRTASSNRTRRAPGAATRELSDEQNRDLFLYGGAAIAAAIVFRMITSAFSSLLLFVLPLVYLYLLTCCPTLESFDAKQQLKRVLRGHHLPDAHPNKPKGLFSETLARIQASVTAELATLPGYEISVMELGGAALVASVRVPSVDMEFHWIGAANRWWYIYGSQIRN